MSLVRIRLTFWEQTISCSPEGSPFPFGNPAHHLFALRWRGEGKRGAACFGIGFGASAS